MVFVRRVSSIQIPNDFDLFDDNLTAKIESIKQRFLH